MFAVNQIFLGLLYWIWRRVSRTNSKAYPNQANMILLMHENTNRYSTNIHPLCTDSVQHIHGSPVLSCFISISLPDCARYTNLAEGWTQTPNFSSTNVHRQGEKSLLSNQDLKKSFLLHSTMVTPLLCTDHCTLRRYFLFLQAYLTVFWTVNMFACQGVC